MPQHSDSYYIRVSRHLEAPRPFATFLDDDDLHVRDPPTSVDEDSETVAPAGSASAVAAAERRRKEEGWNDLGLSELTGIPQPSTTSTTTSTTAATTTTTTRDPEAAARQQGRD